MAPLLPEEAVGALLPRLLPGLLAVQKKERAWERYRFTQALWSVLAHARDIGATDKLEAEKHVAPALTALHALLCAPFDRTSGPCLRNHSEELRCFEVLAFLFPDQALAFLLKSLEASRDAASRCGTLEVL